MVGHKGKSYSWGLNKQRETKILQVISLIQRKPALLSLNHHHHHLSVMELCHFLTRSGLTCPEASSKVCHDFFCRSGSSVLLSWVVYYEAFCLHVVSSFSCILVICPKFELFLTPFQFVNVFCNLSKCILLYFLLILKSINYC
jgi:hypothetical protein